MLLAPKGIIIEKYIAYCAIAETTLAADVAAALRGGALTGVAFFSPRSAQIATQLILEAHSQGDVVHTDAYCLSLAVAEAAAALPWRSIHACDSPTVAAMVDLIVSRSRLAML
jgi:uroporphyrinogen-III synthase